MNKMKIFLSIWFAAQTILISNAQTVVHGVVTDEHKAPIAYASVSIANSIDGATTDSSGNFSFSTTARGKQLLIVSAVGYSAGSFAFDPSDTMAILHLILKNNTRQLGEVVVTAGTIEATDDRVLSLIKPVDILSNASSQGDIVGAFQNLPGVQRNGGDQTGLFVRGGDATETMIALDGTTVQDPFFSSVPGIGQRSRFNPFQIKGMSFSTGGYSARYGQALSSVLDLQTTDLPDNPTHSLAANIAGLWVSGAERREDHALEYSANYINMGPFYSLASTNYAFYKKPESGGASARWVAKSGDRGLFKVAVEYGANSSGTVVPNPNNPATTTTWDLRNAIVTTHASYRYRLNDHLRMLLAAGYSDNEDHILWSDTAFRRGDRRLQARVELSGQTGPSFHWLVGGEVQHFSYTQRWDTLHGSFDETLGAGFAEIEYRPVRWFAIKPGVRAEYSRLLSRGDVTPRIALALKTGVYSQIGLAGGLFDQSASNIYLLSGYRPAFQQAIHYLANYEWIENNRSFRIEAYYKSYRQLVRERDVPYDPNPYRWLTGKVDNSGYGYAEGFDLFWRDKTSLKPFDCWVTYSYIDTRRLYQNYPAEAMPDFVSTHNLNVIVKYYTDGLPIVASAAYNFASGRPYYDPNASTFLGDRSPAYQNLSLKVSYLRSLGRLFSVFYVNIDDLTNHKNVLGYRYSTDGSVRTPILPPQYFSIIFGIYLSLTSFKKDEL